MEVDPWNVHAYWNIKATDMARCRAKLAKKARTAVQVLRFFDISPKADGEGFSEDFDIEVGEACNNWYVNLWRDAKRYSSEIGLRATDGTFVAIARSNEVTTPRASASQDLDFVLAETRLPHFSEHVPTLVPRDSQQDLLRNLFPQRWVPHEEFPVATKDENFPVPDSESFPILLKSELNQYGARARSSKNEVISGGKLPPMEPPPEGMVAQAGIELIPHALSISGSPALQENATAGSGPSQGTPEECAPRPVALEMLAGRSAFSLSSSDISFDLAASLVIEGSCSKNSSLMLFGEPVNLKPDGSFCIRLPLDCGPELVELLYRARSRLDKE